MPRLAEIIIPTGDYRHITKIREGSQSSECWSRERRAEWHETYDGPEIKTTVKEAVENARQKVSERREESVSSDAKKIRGKRGKADILRNGEQEGQREVDERESKKRVQKTKARKAAQKKVVRD